MPERSDGCFQIEFLSGPRDGEVVDVRTAEAVIGRGAGLDLTIISDTVVSRRHARLRCVEGGISIEDLKSSFGTFVDGARITGERTLDEDDVVCIGHTELRCRLPKSEGGAPSQKDRAFETDSTFS
jgi:pSer/pThr/pTyr-binding forkhead associated (FHA) protein